MRVEIKHRFLAIICNRRQFHIRIFGDWDGRYSVGKDILPIIGKTLIRNGVNVYTAPYIAIIVINKDKLKIGGEL